jgi:7-keto-8-aminopelargonate synthetase-like enzyme
VAVYPHNDVAALSKLLAGATRAIVVTESVFSMDGDVAPIQDLAALCERHNALIVVDEAHAVLGPTPDLVNVEALRVGTLSKFLGASGGFVTGPAALIELILNRARSGIFTTAPAPADVAAALAALRVLLSTEGDALRSRLRHNIDLLAAGHPAPIVPVILGDERAALDAAATLLEEGLLVPAIRPPSVAPGTSRLRVTVSADHDVSDVERLSGALARLGVHAGV